MKNIKIKYFNKDYPRLEKLEQGDFIDLRVNNIIKHIDKHGEVVWEGVKKFEEWHYSKGDVLFLGLGVAMELPEGYEAHVLPRSSTFKKTGWILTNGIGIIDNKYNGDDDEWKAMIYCTKDGFISQHERLFQFRIVKNQPELNFEEVESLGNESRGGYGSTDEVEDE